MIAESSYAIVIATFGDRLKNLAPVFQPTKAEPKPTASLPRFDQMTRNSYEF